MSRQNRNPVISFLRHRHTLITERLEGFGRELRPLQFLQQQHIRFANFQPFGDMGQPRANTRGVYYQQNVCTLESTSETRVQTRGAAAISICLADSGRLNLFHNPRLCELVVLV